MMNEWWIDWWRTLFLVGMMIPWRIGVSGFILLQQVLFRALIIFDKTTTSFCCKDLDASSHRVTIYDTSFPNRNKNFYRAFSLEVLSRTSVMSRFHFVFSASSLLIQAKEDVPYHFIPVYTNLIYALVVDIVDSLYRDDDDLSRAWFVSFTFKHSITKKLSSMTTMKYTSLFLHIHIGYSDTHLLYKLWS